MVGPKMRQDCDPGCPMDAVMKVWLTQFQRVESSLCGCQCLTQFCGSGLGRKLTNVLLYSFTLISFSTLIHPFIMNAFQKKKKKARTFQFLVDSEANVSTGAYLEIHANPLVPKGI